MLYLKEANLADAEAEYRFMREMPADENGLTNPWYGVAREDFEAVTLRAMLAWARGEDLPAGFVPETYYFLWEDDEVVGQFRLRHYLTEALRTGAGHIGYGIRRDKRGRGLGKAGLRLMLEIAREVVPEDEIYLRVNTSNPASLHVMLACGGYVEHEDAERYYVRVKK